MVVVTTAGFIRGWTGSRVDIGGFHRRVRRGTLSPALRVHPLSSPILREGATVDPGCDGQKLIGEEGRAGGLPLAEGSRDGSAPGRGRQQLSEQITTRRVERR